MRFNFGKMWVTHMTKLLQNILKQLPFIPAQPNKLVVTFSHKLNELFVFSADDRQTEIDFYNLDSFPALILFVCT